MPSVLFAGNIAVAVDVVEQLPFLPPVPVRHRVDLAGAPCGQQLPAGADPCRSRS
jgi:hypothetical protein